MFIISAGNSYYYIFLIQLIIVYIRVLILKVITHEGMYSNFLAQDPYILYARIIIAS